MDTNNLTFYQVIEGFCFVCRNRFCCKVLSTKIVGSHGVTDKELLELVVMVAWCMWFNRNEARLGKTRQQGSEILQRARFLLDEFQIANIKLNTSGSREDAPWSLPKVPSYKLNVEGVNFQIHSFFGSWGGNL